ncbi:hypothetical protein EI94DRAFT_376605 [Lactarius quietus]|nr:hypothetical protein EI94DRAFT_376605 [Lactarius quietus]
MPYPSHTPLVPVARKPNAREEDMGSSCAWRRFYAFFFLQARCFRCTTAGGCYHWQLRSWPCLLPSALRFVPLPALRVVRPSPRRPSSSPSPSLWPLLRFSAPPSRPYSLPPILPSLLLPQVTYLQTCLSLPFVRQAWPHTASDGRFTTPSFASHPRAYSLTSAPPRPCFASPCTQAGACEGQCAPSLCLSRVTSPASLVCLTSFVYAGAACA